MRIFKDLSLQEIRDCLKELGVPLTNEQFNALTYDELTKMGRKARKAYNLYKQVDDIVKAKGKEKATPPTVQGANAEARFNRTERLNISAQGQ